jgi:hypothetical protein
MTIAYAAADPLLTDAQILAFGWNLRGRAENGVFETALFARYPTAFASFAKQSRQGRLKPGTLWLWRETQPALGFMIVRDTPYGTTRLRYVEAVAMTLARDYQRDGIHSVAYVLSGAASYDVGTIKRVLDYWLSKVSLPVTVYEQVIPGVKAVEVTA